MERYMQGNRFLVTVILLVVVFCTVFISVQNVTQIAYAAEASNYDTTSVLDDLKSSTVNGKIFDIKDYPFNEKGSVKIVNFVEYCYSYKANMRANYGLYLYVYNPQSLNLSTNSKQNKVQLAVSYDTNGNPTRYEKFNLQFCSKVEDSTYKNLFYKFKIIDKQIDGKGIIDRVNSNERRYEISGVELLTYGKQNATEYGVGGTYKFTGYAEGYGPDASAKSTLACVVEDLETLELSVHHTNYRTNVSSVGADHYNEVNTVYFSVPERIYSQYGYLQKIRAEWWEYKTKYAAVTSSQDFYNDLLQSVGKEIPTDDKNADVPAKMWYGFTYGATSTQYHSFTSYEYDWSYNLKTNYEETTGIAIANSTVRYYSKSQSSMVPFAFYSQAVGLDTVFDFLYSSPVAGDVDGTVVSDWIYKYSNDLGHGYIDCNGRHISTDLFENYVDSGRTMGYNDKTIDLGDTFNLMSYDSNHSWWNKLWDYGFSWPATNGDYTNVAPIYELKASDLVGANATISDNLLVNENDIQDLQAYYAAEIAKGNRVVLFRFANTDYFSKAVGRVGTTSGYTQEDSADTYIAQQTVFLDFDIIELTFNKDGVYHVIPVVASPIDIINGYTAPATELEWWKILLGVIMLAILLILLAPLLPYIIRGIIWLICLPYKAISKLSKSIKARKSKKSGGDTTC